MLEGINRAILEGYIGRAPELRYLPSGTAKCAFDLGTTRTWIDAQSGERKNHTEWHRIILWNKTAEWAAQNVKTGQLVYCEGEIRYRPYTDKSGAEKWVTEIVCPKVSIRNWESKADRDARGTTPAPAAKPAQLPIPALEAVPSVGDEDIPF